MTPRSTSQYFEVWTWSNRQCDGGWMRLQVQQFDTRKEAEINIAGLRKNKPGRFYAQLREPPPATKAEHAGLW